MIDQYLLIGAGVSSALLEIKHLQPLSIRPTAVPPTPLSLGQTETSSHVFKLEQGAET